MESNNSENNQTKKTKSSDSRAIKERKELRIKKVDQSPIIIRNYKQLEEILAL